MSRLTLVAEVSFGHPLLTESPFARLRCYLLRRNVILPPNNKSGCKHYVRGSYPSFIAHTGSCARPKSSHRLRSSLGRQVFAGCCESLLEVGLSRRYLCKSFIGCLIPYSGGCYAAFPVSSHSTSAFPTFGLGRRTHLHEQRFQFEAFYRSCRYSFMFRPPILLATLIAPTITSFNVQQLWLLLPNTPRFVTSPCPGYTSSASHKFRY